MGDDFLGPRGSILVVGGPADGRHIVCPAYRIMMPIPGEGGFSTFEYSRRRLRDRTGHIVQVLAPAGEPVDQQYLDANGLTVEQ